MSEKNRKKVPGGDSLAVTSILDPDLHGQTVSLTEKDIDTGLDSVHSHAQHTGELDDLDIELNLDLDDELLNDRDLGVESLDISRMDDSGLDLDLDLDDSLDLELMKDAGPADGIDLREMGDETSSDLLAFDPDIDFELDDTLDETVDDAGPAIDAPDTIDFELDETMIESAPESEADLVDFELDDPAADVLAAEADEDEVIDLELEEMVMEPALDTADDLVDFELDDPAADVSAAEADEDEVIDLELEEMVTEPALDSEDDLVDFELDDPAADVLTVEADGDEVIDLELAEMVEEPVLDTADDLVDFELDDPAADVLTVEADGDEVIDPELAEMVEEPALESEADLIDFELGEPESDVLTPETGEEAEVDFDLDEAFAEPGADEHFDREIDDGQAMESTEFDVDIDFDLDEDLSEPVFEPPVSEADTFGAMDEPIGFSLDEAEDESVEVDEFGLDLDFDLDEALDEPTLDLPDQEQAAFDLDEMDHTVIQDTGPEAESVDSDEDFDLEPPDFPTGLPPVRPSMADTWIDPASPEGTGASLGEAGSADDLLLDDHLFDKSDLDLDDREEAPDLALDRILYETAPGPVDLDDQDDFNPEDDTLDAGLFSLEDDEDFELNGTADLPLDDEAAIDDPFLVDLEAEVEEPEEEAALLGEVIDFDLEGPFGSDEEARRSSDAELEFERDVNALDATIIEEIALGTPEEPSLDLAAEPEDAEDDAPVDIDDMFLEGGTARHDYDACLTETGQPADFEIKDLFPDESAGAESEFEPPTVDFSGLDMMEDEEFPRGVSIYLAPEADTVADEDEEELVEPLEEFDIEEVVEFAPEPPAEEAAVDEALVGTVEREGDLALEEAWMEEMIDQEMGPSGAEDEFPAEADDYYSEEIEQYKLEAAGVEEETVATTALEEAPRPAEMPVPEVDMSRLELLIEQAVRKSVEKVLEKILPGIIEEAVSKEIKKLLDEIE